MNKKYLGLVAMVTILMSVTGSLASESLTCKTGSMDWQKYDIQLNVLTVGNQNYSLVQAIGKGTNIYKTTTSDKGDTILENDSIYFQTDRRLVLKKENDQTVLQFITINSAMVGHGGVSEVKSVSFECEKN